MVRWCDIHCEEVGFYSISWEGTSECLAIQRESFYELVFQWIKVFEACNYNTPRFAIELGGSHLFLFENGITKIFSLTKVLRTSEQISELQERFNNIREVYKLQESSLKINETPLTPGILCKLQ